jgi:hypothetical protein
MSDFRIEKVQHALALTLASGERMEGKVFLEPVARYHAGRQDPRELLNDADAFFPFSVDGRLILVAKDHVKTASYMQPAGATPVSSTKVTVRVHLSDGQDLDGSIEVEHRSDAERLLDFLNGFGGRFLSLTVDRSTQCLVNRHMIAGVQQR